MRPVAKIVCMFWPLNVATGFGFWALAASFVPTSYRSESGVEIFNTRPKKSAKQKIKMDFRIFSQPSAEPEEKRFLRPEGISCWNECFLESRRRVFKALLLKYHPDKNPGNEAVSSITFQFVMKQKEWFSVAVWGVSQSVFKKISRCAAKIKVFFGIESQQQKTAQQRPRRRNPPCEISATSGPKYVFVRGPKFARSGGQRPPSQNRKFFENYFKFIKRK